MKVELAKMAGFCFGVNRAVDTVYEEAKQFSPVYTYGPIIHNETVIDDLEKKGVQVIHKLVQEYSEKGYYVVIIGSGDHPEVQGIVGWSDETRTSVISTVDEAQNLDLKPWKKVCIVAQTTFNYNKFQELIEIIQKKGYDSESTVDKDKKFVVHNTICNATKERQEAARELSGRVDAMLVIGGTSSSNTRKLYEICSEKCRNTYFIQTKEDLENSDFSRFDYVGITAGASTPNNIIEEVQKYVRNEF